METTFIILPFKSSKYLIRCLTSLMKQTEPAKEIIIAENSFFASEEVSAFLKQISNLKFISDKPQEDFDKIKEAIALSNGNTFLSFISVNTVVSPAAVETVKALAGDVIAASYCTADNINFTPFVFEDTESIDSGLAVFQSVFFKKSVLQSLTRDIVYEKVPFELFLDKNAVQGAKQQSISSVLFYFAPADVNFAAGGGIRRGLFEA